jgi:hypothetical protein
LSKPNKIIAVSISKFDPKASNQIIEKQIATTIVKFGKLEYASPDSINHFLIDEAKKHIYLCDDKKIKIVGLDDFKELKALACAHPHG